MRKTLIALIAALIVMAQAAPALACSTQTIMLPNGDVLICTTCGSMTTCV